MPMAEQENKCIVCWIIQNKMSSEEAAGFILGEGIKYPHAIEPRFNDLCNKHAKISIKQGHKSDVG